MNKVTSWFGSIKKYALAHKIVSSIVAIIIIGGGWYMYANASSSTGEVHYVLGTASTSTIISIVSESGQVSSSDSVDIKPKVSGTITWVGATEGEHAYAGQALMSIDNTTAEQQYQDDKASLAAAELQYQKDSASAPIDYQKDQTTLSDAQTDLSDEYTTTFNTLSSAYLDEPAAVSSLDDVLYGYDLSSNSSQWNVDSLVSMFTSQSQVQQVEAFAASAKSDYTTARGLYDPAILAYKATSRTSAPATLEALLQQSIDSTTALAQSAQSELNFLSEVNDLATGNNQRLPSTFTTLQTNARNDLTTFNNDLNSLLAEQKTITNDKQAVTTDQQTIQLDQVGDTTGANPISLQISANGIEKQKEDLATEAQNLADYTIVAPFDGTISVVDSKVGDEAGSAAVATIITTKDIVQLSVNEVDAAKIAVGQKATLTFDAIDGLTLTGTVAEVDTTGTVSQGVVSYGVQITLDTQDSRVKSGMTVDADIQTAVHQNVLVVPSGAVKTVAGASYVQVFTPPLEASSTSQGVLSATAPVNVPVTVGISDDTNVEIDSGLTAGEQIVTRTITAAAAKTAATAASTAATRTTTGAAAGAARGGFGGGGGAAGAAIRL